MSVPARIDGGKIRTEFWDGEEYVSVRVLCGECGLNFLTETERIRVASYAAGKFRETISPRDMWIKVEVVPSWLKMAPIEPGSDFDESAQKAIRQFQKEESSDLVLRFDDLSDRTKVLRLMLQQAEQVDQLSLELAATKQKAVEYQGKAETLDKVVECREGDSCLRYVYKTLGIHHIYKTERQFIDFVEEKLKWFYRPGGKTGPPVAYKQFISQGFVNMRKTDPDPRGRVHDQFVITQKGFVYLKNHFFGMNGSQRQLI